MIKEWIKVLKKEEPTKTELERSRICKDCVSIRNNKLIGYYCGECNCPLIAKLKTTNPVHICKKWEK